MIISGPVEYLCSQYNVYACRFSSDHPGVVFTRENLDDDEKTFQLFSGNQANLPTGPPKPLPGKMGIA